MKMNEIAWVIDDSLADATNKHDIVNNTLYVSIVTSSQVYIQDHMDAK